MKKLNLILTAAIVISLFCVNICAALDAKYDSFYALWVTCLETYGLTALPAELNLLDGAVAGGLPEAGKALVVGSANDVDYLQFNDYIYLVPGTVLPASPSKGMIYIDDTNDNALMYDGSAWVDLTAGASGVTDLDTAYDGGNAVTVDGSAFTLTGSHASNNTFFINKTTGTGHAFQITNAGSGYDIAGTGGTWYATKTGAITCSSLSATTIYLPAIVAAASGNVNQTYNAAGSGTMTFGATSTGKAVFVRAVDLNGNVTLGDSASDTITPTGTFIADITLDDGSTDSPALILKDAADETAALVKVNSGYATFTTAAGRGLQIVTGNFKVGAGTPGVSLNGEDAYITGTLEVDGAVQIDGALVCNAALTANAAVTHASTTALQDNVTVTTGKHLTFGTVQWDDGSDAIDGEKIAAGTIDDDSLDFTDITLVDFTDDVGYVKANGTVEWTGPWTVANHGITFTAGDVNVVTGTVTAAAFSDGTASMGGGTITDGTASLTGGALSGLTSVTRTSQRYVQNIAYAKVGASGTGWVIGAADNISLATLPQSQTAETMVIPITIPLKVGWTITGFSINGQIDSEGGEVTLNADLRKITEAEGGYSDASIGAITQIVKTADYKVTDSKGDLAEVVAADESYYLLVAGTTAATTDIEIASVTVTVSEI